MTTRCEWCRDPMQDRYGIPRFCSAHCAAQHQASVESKQATPLNWDGHTLYALQPPLLLMWRVVCLLCGRDRWLRLPMADIASLHPGPCPGCQGFRVVELDQGIQRPGEGVRAA